MPEYAQTYAEAGARVGDSAPIGKVPWCPICRDTCEGACCALALPERRDGAVSYTCGVAEALAAVAGTRHACAPVVDVRRHDPLARAT